MPPFDCFAHAYHLQTAASMVSRPVVHDTSYRRERHVWLPAEPIESDERWRFALKAACHRQRRQGVFTAVDVVVWEVLRIIAATIWVEHRLRFARERGRTSDYLSGGVGGSPLEPDCIIEGLWSAMRTHPEGELFSIIGLGVQWMSGVPFLELGSNPTATIVQRSGLAMVADHR
jgi:hypothetical protein